MPSNLTIPEFIARWQASTRNERSAAQEHFLNLCDVLGQPSPAQVDPTGERYTFEKGAVKTGGGDGFADVWMRGNFAWEYKGKHKNLDTAYQQLLQYREDLDNPPLLVVCDLDRFEVHTNFTGTAKRVYRFNLADLASPSATPTSPIPPIEVLRALFTDPNRLRPDRTAAQVTEKAAAEFGLLAESLRSRGADPEEAAHFLMRILFCLFAEDTGLLPRGLFTQLVERTRTRPDDFNKRLRMLFDAMSHGGSFGVEDIRHFNGGLFSDDSALPLSSDDLAILVRASNLDWASVEPAIFGTLFERSLDPAKRSQLGAHYTSREDILLIVEPVLMEPLRRRWTEVQTEALHNRAARGDHRSRSAHPPP
ncbi:MAG: type IIL restriction-modification enzyme MmeI, partial [Chloroflexia bacterium]